MLKGKSVIELTNVKTGEVERYENPNIITDGVQKYINALFRFGGHSTSTVMWKKIFGGIRLYDNNLEAVASNYMHPSVDVAKLTGYASITQKSSSSTDTMRGDLNTEETKELDNGVQIVYDFATSEANGQIGCCCLTTDIGGQYAIGQTQTEDYVIVDGFPNGSYKGGARRGFYINYEKERIEVYYKNDSGQITHTTYNPKLALHKKSFECESESDVVESTINTLYFTHSIYDGRIACIERISDTKGVSVYDIKTGQRTLRVDTGFPSDFAFDHIGFASGYIYIFADTPHRLYTIEEANPSNTHYFEEIGVGGNDSTSKLQNGDIIFGKTQLSLKTNERQDFNSVLSGRAGAEFNENSVRLYSFDKVAWARNDFLLFTINNLETPVTKTADKTMKITYTLLESDEATE